MAKKYGELRARMSDERRTRNDQRTATLLASMDLPELREAFGLTQAELAERLEISQSNVSRLERRSDMLISTLQDLVSALGGELVIGVALPDGLVPIRQFEELAA